MHRIKVLIQGYAEITQSGWTASSTTTLITTDQGKHILVDPGCNVMQLNNALHKLKFSYDAIEYVFLTHHHLDHILAAGLFTKSRIIDAEAMYIQDIGILRGETIPDTDIQIIPTPGHEDEHASLLVQTKEGKVAVAGDVFWWANNEKQEIDLDKPDEFASDMQALRKSREHLLSIADWIIPGHGKKFKTHP